MAMGNLASFFISDHPPNPKEILASRITEQDLKMLIKFGLANDDLFVDRAEFVILCMVRLQAVDPDVVTMILKRFEDLDDSGDGVLDYAEILENDLVTQAKIVDDIKQAARKRTEEAEKKRQRRARILQAGVTAAKNNGDQEGATSS